MKCAVKAFVEKNKKNGLFLLDMPTGSGKTYGTISILESYIRGVDFSNIPRMFYITPLIKNIDDVILDLKKRFKPEEMELFESSILKLPANYECVVENLENVVSKIPESIKRKESFNILYSQVKLYNKLKKSRDFDESNCASVLRDIRKTYEPAFRLDLKDELNTNLKSEAERINKLNSKEFNWVKELYPSCLTKNRKVIFMTVNKFVAINDPIISKPYRFVANSIIDESLVFIDEFDASKDVVLGQNIENSCDFKIDLYNMFFSIASSLKSREFENSFFAGELDENDETSSKSSFNKMKNVVLDAYEKFNLKYSFKLDKQDDKDRCFLFDDFTLHTISNGNKKNKVYVTKDDEKHQNIISFDEKEKDADSFYSSIATIKGATTYFLNCCAMLARNYLDYHNEIAKKNKTELMEIDQAVSSILDPFNLDSNIAKTVSRIIINNYSLHNSHKKTDTLDTDFYTNGFRYYDFRDDMSHDTSTKISMCYLDDTPESFLLSLTNRAMVVGLSATASIDNVTGNYNLDYIKNQLDDLYYDIPEEDDLRIRKNVNKRIKHNGEINVHSINALSDELSELIKEIYNNKNNQKSVKTLFETAYIPNSNDEKKRLFEYQRVIKVLSTIKLYINDESSKALLILTNKNLKEDGELYSLEIINKCLECLKKELEINQLPKIYKLYGSDFSEIKENYKRDLNSGNRVILFSSYPSVGSGQNLQYTIEEGENSKEQDVDSIYLEHPTHILIRLDHNSIEEDLIKYIYQMETLRTKGDITPYVAKKNIISAFKSYISKEHRFNGQDNITYGTQSVNNNKVKILMQAIGRICRTDSEKKNVNIYVDDEIFEKVDFSFLKKENRLMNPEFEAIVNKSNRVCDSNKDFIVSLNKTLEQDDRVNSKINKLLSVNSNSWTKESMDDWKIVRDIVIKYPTISNETLEELSKQYDLISIKDFYMHCPPGKSCYRYYYSVNDNNEKQIEFNKKDGCFEVSSEAARLDLFMKSKYIREYFEKNGYATSFEANENILLPVVFQNIYKGILGEEVGKYILNYNHIKLDEINDERKFEKFDFCLSIDKDIYIDFKNWSSLQEFNKNDEYKKIRNKLEKIGGKKAIIINMYFDDYDAKINNLGDIVTVSGLFRFVDNKFTYLTKEEIEKMKDAIYGGGKYGNN